MKKYKKLFTVLFLMALLFCLSGQTAFAFSESDVQAQVDAALEEGAQHVPSFTNVEIGGGRITGTEISEEHPEGISFGMYHAGQYTAPEGAYATVQAVDGTSWYKQYAQDAVEKSPYMAADGSIAYKESIVKKMPPAPKRKDRL